MRADDYLCYMKTARRHLLVPFLIGGLSLTASRVDAQALQTYTNKDLGLAILYPASFTHETAASTGGLGEFSVFTLPGKPAADCTSVLVTLGDGFDRAPVAHHKGNAEEPAPEGHGSLTISEVKRSCVDKDALDDTILSGLVSAHLKDEGIHTIARVGNTAIGPNTVWSAAGAGYGRGANGKRNPNAGTVIFGTSAAVVNGHILVWSVSATDAATFNRLMSVSACFNAPTCELGFSRLSNLQLNVPAPAQSTVASR